jgi:hypothetical protein
VIASLNALSAASNQAPKSASKRTSHSITRPFGLDGHAAGSRPGRDQVMTPGKSMLHNLTHSGIDSD